MYAKFNYQDFFNFVPPPFKRCNASVLISIRVSLNHYKNKKNLNCTSSPYTRLFIYICTPETG